MLVILSTGLGILKFKQVFDTLWIHVKLLRHEMSLLNLNYSIVNEILICSFEVIIMMRAIFGYIIGQSMLLNFC